MILAWSPARRCGRATPSLRDAQVTTETPSTGRDSTYRNRNGVSMKPAISNSRQVELGNSMRDWLGRIGVSVGGKTDRSVREQAERISRCRLTFHLLGTNGSGLVNQSIVDKALFIDTDERDPRQGRLSLETAQLSEGFFEQLKRHPMPLEEAAIRALSNNAKALDVYMWLAYRLHVLKTDKTITWTALKAQFGIGTSAMFNFRSKFAATLGLAMAVYPAARVDVTEQGVVIKPSRPPVAPKQFPGGTYCRRPEPSESPHTPAASGQGSCRLPQG